jgi:hypothetical protein
LFYQKNLLECPVCELDKSRPVKFEPYTCNITWRVAGVVILVYMIGGITAASLTAARKQELALASAAHHRPTSMHAMWRELTKRRVMKPL